MRMKGYGHLPLRPLVTETITRKSTNAQQEEVEEHFRVVCQYQGNKVNLFTNGSFAEFEDLTNDLLPAQNRSESRSLEYEKKALKAEGQND